jgi:hypothetical protein
MASDMIPRLGISKTFEELKKIVSDINIIRKNLQNEKIKYRNDRA